MPNTSDEQPPQLGLLAEFWDFLKHNKRWWILPLLVAILLLAILVLLAGVERTPFIYPTN